MKQNLLLCFDAFGTLFRPRSPVHKQYAEVARKYGISGFTDDDLAQSFRTAFKEESRIHPNYGRATDLGSTKWWANVIEGTFRPFIPGEDKKLPPILAPALLHRFGSKEGYEMCPDTLKVFKQFVDTRPGQVFRRVDHRQSSLPDRRLVVGVITNSDDRVPDVLSSFGLRIKPLRHGEDPRPYHPTNEPADIDFAIMSYDVGHEKPDKRIFDAATHMLKDMLRVEGQEDASLSSWRCLYVGDELIKDAGGALDAGWDAVLIDREQETIFEEDGARTSSAVQSRMLGDGREVPVISDLTALWTLMS
ncbi:hypothetical protein CAC42_2725 [Sphaceloma murrayae]|uniref:Uncharacterized protein n=1 Tax=Sphaceloma murrayae TaxID=2082308 RepID=A0A2K1R0H7_9PEZI|nr:hypothetical protein CAC42_2725 [Sphaceloma murrayae]